MTAECKPAECKPRWTRRKQDRPQELLTAALELFVERGFAATKLDDVARRAGVAKGTLYLYFENKEELFKSVIRETVVPHIAEAEQLVQKFEGSTANLFKELTYVWCERICLGDMAGICKLMFAEANHFPELARFYHDEVILRHEKMIAQLITRGIDNGEFKAVDVNLIPQIISAPIVMMILRSKTFADYQIDAVSVKHFFETYIETILAGLQK